jgi:hypothetical protein
MNKIEKDKLINALSSIADLKHATVGEFAHGSAHLAGKVIDLLSARKGSDAYNKAMRELKFSASAAKTLKTHA